MKRKQPLSERIFEAAQKYPDVRELNAFHHDAWRMEGEIDDLKFEVVRARTGAFALFIALLVLAFVAYRPGL